MDLNKENSRFAFVVAKNVHPSRILPTREFNPELAASIRRDGVQQPLIVRPLPGEKGTYEIIDGHLRHKSVQADRKVLVLIRYDVTDADVFKISEATFKRSQRNTYERAYFYRNWVETVAAKRGSLGSQKVVAEMAGLSQAEVSNYVSISRLFERLGMCNIALAVFNALKSQSVNKLYALAKVEDQSATLVMAKMAEVPNMSLKELKKVIEKQTSPMRAIERLVEEDDEEESESIRIDQLTNAVQELEVAINKAREGLTSFTSKLVANPHRFISPDVFKRIRTMLNALKKIEKEAARIIRSDRKASVSNKHGEV